MTQERPEMVGGAQVAEGCVEAAREGEKVSASAPPVGMSEAQGMIFPRVFFTPLPNQRNTPTVLERMPPWFSSETCEGASPDCAPASASVPLARSAAATPLPPAPFPTLRATRSSPPAGRTGPAGGAAIISP